MPFRSETLNLGVTNLGFLWEAHHAFGLGLLAAAALGGTYWMPSMLSEGDHTDVFLPWNWSARDVLGHSKQHHPCVSIVPDSILMLFADWKKRVYTDLCYQIKNNTHKELLVPTKGRWNLTKCIATVKMLVKLIIIWVNRNKPLVISLCL